MPRIDELTQPSVDALRAVAGVPAVEARATSLEGRASGLEGRVTTAENTQASVKGWQLSLEAAVGVTYDGSGAPVKSAGQIINDNFAAITGRNIFFDPFGEALASRPTMVFGTRINYFGTLNLASANTPFAGKPTLSATGTGNVQRMMTLAGLGVAVGDTITARGLFQVAATGGAFTINCRDAAQTLVGSQAANATSGAGVKDVSATLVIPAGTVYIELRAAAGSGGSGVELFAVGLAKGILPPDFGYVPLPGIFYGQVATQKNLWPDPFLRQYNAGVRFQDGWTYAQLAGVAIPPVVTASANSPYLGQAVIRSPTGGGQFDMNIDARRLGLKLGDQITVVLEVYSAQTINVTFFGRDASNAAVGSTTATPFTFASAGTQTLRVTQTVTAAMMTAVFFQCRFMATQTVGATPVEILSRGIFVNNTQPLMYDDAFHDDMTQIERHRRPGFGGNRLRESHKRLMERTLGASSQLRLALIGDSYLHLTTRISQPLATYLQTTYGNAGVGFVGFGNPDAGTGNINGTNWQGITVTTVGTWTSSYATGSGPDICQVTATGASNIYKVNNIQAGSSAVYLLAQPVAGASYDYSTDGGTTWANVDASTGTNLNTTALTIPAGQFSLWIRPSAGSPIFYGVDLQSASPGVRVHKLAATGSSAAQWAARVTDAKWQAAMQALAPHAVIVQLGPNDQTSSTAPNVFGGYISTIISTIQSILPLADVLLLSPADNQRANNVEMAAYASVARNVALGLGVAYRNLQQDYGLRASDYIYSGSRPWYASDLLHPDPANNGGYPTVAAIAGLLSPNNSGE